GAGPQINKGAAQAGLDGRRAGEGHPHPLQGASQGGGQVQGGGLPHHDDGGGEDPRPLRRLGQLFQRGTDGGRVGGAAPRDHGGGGVRSSARRYQPLNHGGELGQAHED